MGPGRSGPLRREPGLGLPDRQRHREPQVRARTSVEPAGLVIVLEPLNPENHPGLFLTKIAQAYEICRAVDSPGCKILDDIYHQQITEGNLIPNIDAGLGRDRGLPPRRHAGPEGAGHGRDQLQQHLQAHPRQGLRGRPVHGARQQQAGQRRRAGRHRRLSRLRRLLIRKDDMTENINRTGTAITGTATAMGRASPGATSSRPRPRPPSPPPSPPASGSTPPGRTPSASASSAAAAAARARRSTAVNSSPGVEIVALCDLFQDRIDGSLKTLREKVPAALKVKPETLLHRLRRLQEAPGRPGHQLHRHGRPAGLPADPPQGRGRGRASTSSWRSRSPSTRSASARSSPARELAAKKGLAIVAGTQRRHQKPLPRDHEAHPRRRHRRDRRRPVLLEPGRPLGHQEDGRR